MIIPRPSKEQLNSNTSTEKYIKIHFPEFHELVSSISGCSWSEKLYKHYNNITSTPRCPVCGKALKFRNPKVGYAKYCSPKCSNSDPNKISKTKQTCIELYGGVAPACSQIVKNKIKSTCIDRFGTENAMQNKGVSEKSKQANIKRHGGCGNASGSSSAKFKTTMTSLYGVENPMQSDAIKKKYRDCIKEKYGVDWISKNQSIVDKIITTRKNSTCNKYDDVISINGDDWICQCPHSSCTKCIEKTYITTGSIYRDRKRDHTEPCTKLLKICKQRTSGTSIELFVQRILDENDIIYTTNDRSIISPKEVDIYIPNKKIAIECNGIQSHCSDQKSPSYHKQKFKSCQQYDVQLLTIWQDWIENKTDIVRSVILSKLGVYKTRYYARLCVLKEICATECNQFLESNHIQGPTSATIHIGAYTNNELISVMTFGHKRKCSGDNTSNNDIWELSRFCTKVNTQVVGIANRLIKYFIKQYNPAEIYSFSSNDISSGNLYEKLGFKQESECQSYWYIDIKSMKRYHRSTFTKDSIVKLGWKPNKNGWTETEVMREHGYYQIYDSGMIKWKLKIT